MKKTIKALFIVFFVSALLPVSSALALSGRIVIEGTDDSQELMRALARRFERLHPGVSVVVPDGIGSSGGIRKVKEGKADFGRTSRPLDQSEMKYGLAYIVFAKNPVVFFLSGVKGVEGLTSEQITGIYSGKIALWRQLGGDAEKIYYVGREAGDSSRRVLSRYIPAFKDMASGGKTYYSAIETVHAVKSHAGAVGYGPMSTAFKAGLKVLKFNGIKPSPENIENGSYELSAPLGLVFGKNRLTPQAAAFVDFLYGAEGRKIITGFGCLPVGR